MQGGRWAGGVSALPTTPPPTYSSSPNFPRIRSSSLMKHEIGPPKLRFWHNSLAPEVSFSRNKMVLSVVSGTPWLLRNRKRNYLAWELPFTSPSYVRVTKQIFRNCICSSCWFIASQESKFPCLGSLVFLRNTCSPRIPGPEESRMLDGWDAHYWGRDLDKVELNIAVKEP